MVDVLFLVLLLFCSLILDCCVSNEWGILGVGFFKLGIGYSFLVCYLLRLLEKCSIRVGVI